MKKAILFLFTIFSSLIVKAQGQNALDFDGIDDEITVPAASALIANSSQISITCWVYPTNANPMYPDFDGFCGFRNELDCDFYLMQISPSNTIEARFRNSSGTIFTIAYQGLILNTWQHLALTYDGSMLRLYQGSLPADSVAASGVITNTNESFHIGTLPYSINPYWLTGKLDEISLFKRALTPVEIECISQESVNGNDPDCMLYYACNQGTAGMPNLTISSLDDWSNHIDGDIYGFTMTGLTSNFTDGVTNAISSTVFLCQGDFYVIGNDTITLGGNYYTSTPLNGGCGTIHEYQVTISAVDTFVVQTGDTLTCVASPAFFQWVDCLDNYNPIPGANDYTFVPSVDGSYAVVVSQNGCVDTSSCYQVSNVGVNENSMGGLVFINPNPVVGKAFIELKNSLTSEIVIYDLGGKIIYEGVHRQEKITIDTSEWQPGVYFVTINNDGITYHSRLIKY